jgi:large subunit ribosomal protein L15
MKLHELRPAAGSRTARTRVGRGIAAGKGKTAGRGTKGQKARAGSSIPPWFEGGQTPLHQRIPKLRGFRNPFKVQYEVVNLGRISALVELGALEAGDLPGAKPKASRKPAPVTVNQEILKAVGLVRSLDKPLKVLGQGDVTRALFVVADAFSKSAASKIEAAGGTASVIEMPTERVSRRRGGAPEAPASAALASAAGLVAVPAGGEAEAVAADQAQPAPAAPKSRAKARGAPPAVSAEVPAETQAPVGQAVEDEVAIEGEQAPVEEVETPSDATARKPRTVRSRASSPAKAAPEARGEAQPEPEGESVTSGDAAAGDGESGTGDQSPSETQPAGDA